jgi:uncharacterized protein
VTSLAAEKVKNLRNFLERKGRVIISYSGGVDSSLLAAMAKEVLSEHACCVILDSPLIPRKTLSEALLRASELGISCRVVPFPILDDPQFVLNRKDRCYHCKKYASRILKESARNFGEAIVIDGVNTSDLAEYRPGIMACKEEGIMHPFVDCGLSKEDIRSIAHNAGFSFWDLPSTPCLASRIPYGEEITRERIQIIEKAEEIVKNCGISVVRVRSHGAMARIEVLPGEFLRLLEFRETISRELHALGFRYITLDFDGFRSGSLDNE